ncbi:type II secretion system protein GspN [Candidatus Poribacteria bacterium]|nr:type II secretion system protein GspN [Candidatus Poribacteria bacterium]
MLRPIETVKNKVDKTLVMSPNKPQGAPSTRLIKLLALLLAAGLLLLCLVILMVRPYKRLATLMGDMLTRTAPPGTTFATISAGFPSTFVITDLDIPVSINGQVRQLAISKISGKVSVLSLLRGRMETEMDSDLFGGTLWMSANAGSPLRAASMTFPAAFEARARALDVSRICSFLQTPVSAKGLLDADFDATLPERKLALLIGKDIDVPPIETKRLVLPANHNVELLAKLSAKDGKIFIEEFQSLGSAYEISGKGIIKLAKPFELSPAEGSFSVIFKENFTITDERLAKNGAREIAAALVASRGKLTFHVEGTIGKPVARLDSVSSLGDALGRLNR